MTKPKILHIGLCVTPDPNHGFKKAFIEHSSEYKEINPGEKNLNSLIINMASVFKPDLVFMQIQTANVINQATIDCLHGLGCVIINWNGDVRDSTPDWMLQIGKKVISAYSNMRDVHNTRGSNMRAEWLEIGYDPAIYTPHGPVQISKPIVFFGNNPDSRRFPLSGFRIQMCNFLRQKFAGNFGEYGFGPMAVGNFNNSQPTEAAAYRYAKIAINCSHYEIERYTSDRMFRILGTGKAICLAKWYPGCEELFKNRFHLVFWTDLNQLEGLIRYYMDPNNEGERIEIVKNGQELALREYSYDAMVKNIINIYNKYKHETA